MTDVEQRLAALEAENASLCAEVAAIRPAKRDAPKPDDDEAVTITTHRPGAGFIMPTVAELHALHSIAQAAYPVLRSNFDDFANAFRAIGALGRSDKLDEKRAMTWWIDAAEAELRAIGASSVHMNAAAFVGAVLAHGDIAFRALDRFPHELEFGLVYFGGRPACDAWRQVLARKAPAAPAAPAKDCRQSPASVRY